MSSVVTQLRCVRNHKSPQSGLGGSGFSSSDGDCADAFRSTATLAQKQLWEQQPTRMSAFNTEAIIGELEAARDRIGAAIAALQGSRGAKGPDKAGHIISREKISE